MSHNYTLIRHINTHGMYQEYQNREFIRLGSIL